MKLKNSKGNVYYGMHFYPGVAEYQDPADASSFRVFLNENTIRQMDPTYAGRPVYVLHVDEVEEDIDELRKEADGWVVESFYNQADGKHWAKFLICSESGEQAIKNGFRLSNAYHARSYGNGGVWNGVTYDREVAVGEYEHLAIVPNPRYQESVILTPDAFKKYNDEKLLELKRLSNSKKESGTMKKFSFFKREKMENAIDIENVSVILPKSGKELTITQLVNALDEVEVAKDKPVMIKVGDEEMTLEALVEECVRLKARVEELESSEEDEEEYEEEDEFENKDEEDEFDNEDLSDEEKAKKKKAAELEVAAKRKKQNELKLKNDLEAKKLAKKEKAKKLRNASDRGMDDEDVHISLPADQIERGKSRYGS